MERELGRAYFLNTVVADVALAAYVNESTRYRVMGRLKIGSAVNTPIDSSSLPLQTRHEAKAIDPGADDGHDPMEFGSRRPSIPTAKVVNDCQAPMHEAGRRTKGQRG